MLRVGGIPWHIGAVNACQLGATLLVTAMTCRSRAFAQTAPPQPMPAREAGDKGPGDGQSGKSLPPLPSTGDDVRSKTSEGEASEPSPARSTSIWYGYQTLACDVASVVLFTSGITVVDASKSPVVGASISAAGGFVYVFGAPIVHLAHGRDPAAVLDTAIRLALPAVGLLLGAGIGVKVEGDGSFAAEELGGAAVGFAAAMAFDALVLAREPRRAPTVSAGHGAGASIAPVVHIVRDGREPARTLVGVGGTF